MNRFTLLCAAISIFSQLAVASPKSDSIVAFTGARTKVVWMRFNWANADYTPKARATAEAAGASVMLFDTDEGQERVLGTGLSDWQKSWNQGQVRISRSGKWATVADEANTYIFDLTGPANKRVFLAKSSYTYWTVKAWGRDVATGAEFVYVLDNFNHAMTSYSGTALYKIPVNADGSANVGAKVAIPVNGNPKIDGSFSVSSDQKKLGGLFPWSSNPAILDVATGGLTTRKNGASCHTNIAPDNSYAFFHLNDDHNGIYVWPSAVTSSANSYIPLSQNMVGSLDGEFWCPRWSNTTRFMATTFPAPPGTDDIENGAEYGWSAATTKAKPLGTFQICVLHKFAADLKSITGTQVLASDYRNFEYQPDVWINDGTSSISQQTRLTRSSGMEIVRNGNLMSVSQLPVNASVRVMDAQGRVVRQSPAGVASIDVNQLNPGAYVVACGSVSKRVTINR